MSAVLINPIYTDEDHEAALRQIEQLWNAETGTPEGDQLDILFTLVEAYEKKHYPIPPPNPIDMIEFVIEQRGLTPKELIPYKLSTLRRWTTDRRRR